MKQLENNELFNINGGRIYPSPIIYKLIPDVFKASLYVACYPSIKIQEGLQNAYDAGYGDVMADANDD